MKDKISEEEKKAIEDIKNIVADLEDAESGAIISLQQEEINSLKIIAELVEKQQKEIEQQAKEIARQDRSIHKLNLDKIQQQKEIEEFRGIKNGTTIIYIGKAKYVREDKINKYYISKDKIREKIKEIENEHTGSTRNALSVLQELLEE